MEIIADMHTHTVASGHAYSTVNELAHAARARGLKALAITDHGPTLPGGPHLYHFGAMRFIPTWIEGVRIFRGVEANIVSEDGSVDMPEQYLAKLDFVMAGLHESCGFDHQGIARNTEAITHAMKHPRIKAISHTGNPAFPVHFEELARVAVKTQTALEINNSSFSMSRKGSRPNCERLAEIIAASGAPVIVGSDAHIAQGVGEFAEAIALLEKVGIPAEQVVNSSIERLLGFLGLDDEPAFQP
jgi:putative hydrolase